MSYFSLRKQAPEPEPEEVDEEQQEAKAEPADDEPEERSYGPVLTGLLGPGQWIAARCGTGAAWGAQLVSAWSVVYYGGWVAVGVPLAWVVAVLAFIPRDLLERSAAAIDAVDVRRRKPAPEPAVETSPEDEREAVRRLLLDLIGEAPGVHLRTVLAHLQQHGQWEGRTVTDLRARLALLGIPHDRSVKVAGVPTWGVRRTALDAPSPADEAPPSPASSPPV